jgi:hypothetical protein
MKQNRIATSASPVVSNAAAINAASAGQPSMKKQPN